MSTLFTQVLKGLSLIGILANLYIFFVFFFNFFFAFEFTLIFEIVFIFTGQNHFQATFILELAFILWICHKGGTLETISK